MRRACKRMIVARNQRIGRQIALGRLVEDAGLPELIGGDLAALLGGLLQLKDEAKRDPVKTLALWRVRFTQGEGEGSVNDDPDLIS